MGDCIFCKMVEGKARSWKVYENESVFAFLDVNPVNEYHTLVVPKDHYVSIFDVPEIELKEVMVVIKKNCYTVQQKIGNPERSNHKQFRI